MLLRGKGGLDVGQGVSEHPVHSSEQNTQKCRWDPDTHPASVPTVRTSRKGHRDGLGQREAGPGATTYRTAPQSLFSSSLVTPNTSLLVFTLEKRTAYPPMNFRVAQDICTASKYLSPNLLITVMVSTWDHAFSDSVPCLPSRTWNRSPLP